MAYVPAGDNPIVSEFADDPEMTELVEIFVEELPLKAQDLAGAAGIGDLERIRVLAHQMKGSAPGYGFSQLGDAAREIEEFLSDDPANALNIEELKRRVDALIGLCQRVQGPTG